MMSRERWFTKASRLISQMLVALGLSVLTILPSSAAAQGWSDDEDDDDDRAKPIPNMIVTAPRISPSALMIGYRVIPLEDAVAVRRSREITEQDVINACRASIVTLGTLASYFGPGAALKALQSGGKVMKIVVKRFDLAKKFFELEVHVTVKVGGAVIYNVYSEFKSLPETGCTWAIERLG